MSESVRGALHELHEARGATFVQEDGWEWVESYGDREREYAAVRRGVGLWDLSPLNKWAFRGPDATEAVQRVHANDILGMRAGQVRYGAFLDEDGLLIDDGTVFRFGDDHLWVMTNGMQREAHFADATKGLDVGVEYLGTALPSMQLQGPGSRELLRPLIDVDLDALAYFRFIPVEVHVGGAPAIVSRTGFSGELGYELFLEPEHAPAVWETLEGAGAVPYGVGIIEAVRVETGMIVTGYDYQEHERSPFDVGLDATVALNAGGEFMGKDKLREMAEAPPNRFKTVRIEGSDLPAYGATVRVDEEAVGVLTSPALSPTLGPLGLAILRADVATEGQRVSIDADSGPIAGTVDVLGLYDPKKERPRA